MPPAAVPAPAAAAYTLPATRITIPAGAAALGAADDDLYALKRDGPLQRAAGFADVERPAAPADARVARYQLQAAVCLAITFDLTDPAVLAVLKGSNVLQHEISPTDASALIHEAANRQLLEEPLDDWREMATRILGCATFAAAERQIDSLRLEGDFTAAHPCPPELEWLRLTTWYDLYAAGKRCDAERPACLLAMLFVLLGSRARRNTREDEASTLRTTADALEQYVREWARLRAGASDASVARQLPWYLSALYSALTAEMQSQRADAALAAEDLRDGHVLLIGRSAEIAETLWRRIYHHVMPNLSVLGELAALLPNVAGMRVQFDRLLAAFLPGLQGEPQVRVHELNRRLEELSKRAEIIDLRNAGSTAPAIVTTLIDSHSAVGAAAGGGPGGAAGGADASATDADAAAASGTLRHAAISAAVSARAFRDAVSESTGLEGVDLLEECFRSRSTILIRYLIDSPAWLKHAHDFFGVLDYALIDRLPYFSRSLVLEGGDDDEDDKGYVPDLLAEYVWSKPQMSLFFGGKWGGMDVVNREAKGFTEIRFLENNTDFAWIPPAMHYLLESSLTGAREHFTRLVTGIGYPAVPTKGYSVADAFKAQSDLVHYIDGLIESARREARQWADDLFREHILARAGALYLRVLNSASPKDDVFDCFVDSGTPYFSLIKQKKKSQAPLVMVQRAFPHLLPTTPQSLPGSIEFQGAVPAGGPAGGGTSTEDGGKDGGKGKKRGGDKDPKGVKDAPGSCCTLAKVLKDGKLFLANRVYDLEGIAKELKCKVEDKCWPVLLSSKSGNLALTLCPHYQSHGGMNGKFHTAPSGFDREKLSKKYSEPATPAQAKEAGWNKKAKI